MNGGVSPDAGIGLTSATTTNATGTTYGPDATVLESSGDIAEMSHFDSFFATSGWTREDVLMVAGLVQVAAWVALLYLEVSE